MPAESDAPSPTAIAYQRLAHAPEDEFRNLAFHQGDLLVHHARHLGDLALAARLEAVLEDMAAHSPNEWIRREALHKLAALRG